MSQGIDANRLRRLKEKFESQFDADDPNTVRPLLDNLARIAIEGNRRGIMQGLDKDGNPMPAVTYRTGRARPWFKNRPKNWGVSAKKLTLNNLTTAEYRQLTGPPLAPRGLKSRVITNFRIKGFQKAANGEYGVQFGWQEVLSAKGKPFLRYHFKGSGRLPRRDLRGIRPEDTRAMADSMAMFYRALIKMALTS